MTGGLWCVVATWNSMNVILRVFSHKKQKEDFIEKTTELGLEWKMEGTRASTNQSLDVLLFTPSTTVNSSARKDKLTETLFGKHNIYFGCGEPMSLEIKKLKFNTPLSGWDLD